MIERYPHPSALFRQARGGSIFAALQRLETTGLVRRREDRYRLTRQGRNELAINRALLRLITRAQPPGRPNKT